MALPDDYWRSYEGTVTSFQEYMDAVSAIAAYENVFGSRFVWRGVIDASWAMYSSLVRRYADTHAGRLPSERVLRNYERSVLDEAREWQLDWHATGGRLVALELLAVLQHYGVPSRLLDFSFNPLIALWFAVEQDSPLAETGGDSGRVFAVDVEGRRVSGPTAASDEPWWSEAAWAANSPWCTQSYIWKPPPMEPRIVRQEGCFLMGGIPSTQPPRNVRVAGGWRPLHADEIRQCMSVPFGLLSFERAVAARAGLPYRGAPPTSAGAFTLRISNKAAIRAELERMFGYSHASLFPDASGFATYGESFR